MNINELRASALARVQELEKMLAELDHAEGRPEEIAVKRTQLKAIASTIEAMERQQTTVPDELRNLRIRLASELNRAHELGTLRDELTESLEALLAKVRPKRTGGGTRGRGSTRRVDGDGTVTGGSARVPRDLLPPAGTTPTHAAIAGEPLAVDSWCDVLTGTAEWLLKKGHLLPTNGIVGNRLHLIKDQPTETAHKKLSNGKWICVNYGAPQTVRAAYYLLLCVGLPLEDLKIDWE